MINTDLSSKYNVLVACEFSGIVRDAFIHAGHTAISCDLLPTEKPGPHYQGNVLDILYQNWKLIIAHPPCTRLANSGIRWLNNPPAGKTVAEMWDELYTGARFYKKFIEHPCNMIAIENPIMHIYAQAFVGNHTRHIIQPWQFGEPVFKATGFWLKGLPPLTPTNILIPPEKGTEEYKKWSKIHFMLNTSDRAKNRSRTFRGVAQAMVHQWGKYL